VVGADLVSQATGSAVDHHAHRPDRQAEPGCRRLVVDGVHHLNLEEVVARTQTPHLGEATPASVFADTRRIGVSDEPVVLAAVQIPVGAVPPLDRIPRPGGQQPVQLVLVAQLPYATGAHAAGGAPVELVHECRQPVVELAGLQRRDQQPYPAGDVEAHPSRRDDTTPGHVRGGDTPDREAITPVHVRHGIRGLDDAWQRRHVGHLMQGPVRDDVREQRTGREHHPGDAHLPHRVDPPPEGCFFDQVHRCAWLCDNHSPHLLAPTRFYDCAAARGVEAQVPVFYPEKDH